MSASDQFNNFFVDVYSRIGKIEERAMAEGLGSSISVTEIHIIEKIGDLQPVRMSEVAHSIGVTLATLTVACDKLQTKELVVRQRDAIDRRVVNVSLTPKGEAAYAYHKQFHQRMIDSIMETLTPEQATVLSTSLARLQTFFKEQEEQ